MNQAFAPAFGQSRPRRDALDQVLGRVLYTEDLRFPGLLHVRFLRSRHAHARILRIDTSRAETAPGVAAVITGKDFAFNRMGAFVQDQPVLADDRVRHYGDPVAAIAATTVAHADRALALIEVDYDPLPAVFDPEAALAQGAPILHGSSNILNSYRLIRGDVAAGFAQSDLIVEETFRTQAVEQAPLETQIAVAVPEPDGRVTIHTPGSRPFAMRTDVSRALGLEPDRVHIVAPPSGGAFGGKSDTWVEPACAALALKTGRPVRAMYTREEEFACSTLRHPFVMHYKSGVSRDGRLLARHVRMTMDTGAYACLGEAALRKGTLLAIGPYRVPNVLVDSRLVYTNNPVSSAMRGFGVPQACFGWESHTETIADRLGLDSCRFRLLNAFDEGDTSHGGQVLASVGLKATMAAARKAFGLSEDGQ